MAVTRRDRSICLNCGEFRHTHYAQDGSWAAKKCSEYEGRVPTDEEWKAMLKSVDRELRAEN